jgi:DNA-binding beta-propeller fold protein YncE
MRAAWVAFLLCVSASAQVLESRTYATSGHPTEAIATPDGKYVLVTVDRQGASGIDVFEVEPGKLKKIAFQSLGSQNAQGILLIPHSTTLAVGLSNAGVAFLPLDETLRGKAKPGVLPQGERSGTGYLAVTPDGQYLFAANEYGAGGNVGVIALHRDQAGAIHPEAITQIPTPNTTPGVTISPDGSRLYAVGEVIRPEVAARLPGRGVKTLERDGCVQADPGRSRPNGVLYAIDVSQARALTRDASPDQVRRVVVARVDAGCSPVREAVTADGRTVYVTARGDNRILAFDTAALEGAHRAARFNPDDTAADAEPPLSAAFDSGGAAPAGLKLFAGDKYLLVADSNRFAGGPGNASVFDLTDPARPVLRQTIHTGAFPRNITASPDGATLYLTIFSGDELMVLTPARH